MSQPTVFACAVVNRANFDGPNEYHIVELPAPEPHHDTSLVSFESGDVGIVHKICDTRADAEAWQLQKRAVAARRRPLESRV